MLIGQYPDSKKFKSYLEKRYPIFQPPLPRYDLFIQRLYAPKNIDIYVVNQST